MFDVEYKDAAGRMVKGFVGVDGIEQAKDLCIQKGIPVRYRRAALIWDNSARRVAHYHRPRS